MKIVVCGSIDFTQKIKEIADVLIQYGHTVEIPLTSQRIIHGEFTLQEFLAEKDKNTAPNSKNVLRKIEDDVIRRYYSKIQMSEAILVLNIKKKGIANYIGGNTFLEMGFAHVLNKTIYLYNKIPQMSYSEEIVAMQPIILDSDLTKIKS